MGENVIALILAVLGSSVLSSVATGWFTARKQSVETSKVLQDIWHSELSRLRDDVKALEEKLNSREVVIETLKAENKQLRKELEELKIKYVDQVEENRVLQSQLESLTEENRNLGLRISKLERET